MDPVIQRIEWLPSTQCLALVDVHGQLHVLDNNANQLHLELASSINPAILCGSLEGISYATALRASRAHGQRLPANVGRTFSLCPALSEPPGPQGKVLVRMGSVGPASSLSGDLPSGHPDHLLLLSDSNTILVLSYEPLPAVSAPATELQTLNADMAAPSSVVGTLRPRLPLLLDVGGNGADPSSPCGPMSSVRPGTTRSAPGFNASRASSLASSVMLLANPPMPMGSVLLSYASASTPKAQATTPLWKVLWRNLLDQPGAQKTAGGATAASGLHVHKTSLSQLDLKRASSAESVRASPRLISRNSIGAGSSATTSPKGKELPLPALPSPNQQQPQSQSQGGTPWRAGGEPQPMAQQLDGPDVYWMDSAAMEAVQAGDMAVLDGRHADGLGEYVHAHVFGFLPSMLVLLQLGCLPCALQLLRAFSGFVQSAGQQALVHRSSSAGGASSREAHAVAELQQQWTRVSCTVLTAHLRAHPGSCPDECSPGQPHFDQDAEACTSSAGIAGGPGLCMHKKPRTSGCNVSTGGRMPPAEVASLPMLLQAARRQLGLACQCLAFLSCTLHSLGQARKAAAVQHARQQATPSRHRMSLLLGAFDPASPSARHQKHRDSSATRVGEEGAESQPHIVGLPIPVVWHAITVGNAGHLGVPGTTMEEASASASESPSSVPAGAGDEHLVGSGLGSHPQNSVNAPQLKIGHAHAHAVRLRLCHAAYDVLMLERAAVGDVLPSLPTTPVKARTSYEASRRSSLEKATRRSFPLLSGARGAACHASSELAEDVLDELRSPEFAAGLLMMAHACDVEVQQYWLMQLQRQGHGATDAARALQVLLPVGRTSFSGSGSWGGATGSPAPAGMATSLGGASTATLPQLLAATRLNWQLLHHYPSAARSAALWKELGMWRKAAVLAFSVHQVLMRQPPALRRLATGLLLGEEEEIEDGERGSGGGGSPWPGSRLISALASGRTRRPVAPPPGSCLQIGWSILEEQMGPGLMALEVQDMCHTLHELVAIPLNLLGPTSDVYVHLLLKVAAKLVEVLPRRMCITPLLPAPMSQAAALVSFCQADMRAQLQGHLGAAMAAAFLQIKLARSALGPQGTGADLVVRGMIGAPEAEACLKMLLRWTGGYDPSRLEDSVDEVALAMADTKLVEPGDWEHASFIALLQACLAGAGIMPQSDCDAVIKHLAAHITAPPGSAPGPANSLISPGHATATGARPAPAGAGTPGQQPTGVPLVDLNDVSMYVDVAQVMGTMLKVMQPHLASIVDMVPGLKQDAVAAAAPARGAATERAPSSTEAHAQLSAVPEAGPMVDRGSRGSRGGSGLGRGMNAGSGAGDGRSSNGGCAHGVQLHAQLASHLGALIDADWVLVCRAHVAALLQRVREVTCQGMLRPGGAAAELLLGAGNSGSGSFARLGVTISGGSVCMGRPGVLHSGAGVPIEHLHTVELLLLQWVCALVSADRVHADTELQASTVTVLSAVGGAGLPPSAVAEVDSALRTRNIFNAKLAEQVNRLKACAGSALKRQSPAAAAAAVDAPTGDASPFSRAASAPVPPCVTLPGDRSVYGPEATRAQVLSAISASLRGYTGAGVTSQAARASSGAIHGPRSGGSLTNGPPSSPRRCGPSMGSASGRLMASSGAVPASATARCPSLLQCTVLAAAAQPRLFTHSSRRGFRNATTDLGLCFTNALLTPALPGAAPGISSSTVPCGNSAAQMPSPLKDPEAALHALMGISSWGSVGASWPMPPAVAGPGSGVLHPPSPVPHHHQLAQGHGTDGSLSSSGRQQPAAPAAGLYPAPAAPRSAPGGRSSGSGMAAGRSTSGVSSLRGAEAGDGAPEHGVRRSLNAASHRSQAASGVGSEQGTNAGAGDAGAVAQAAARIGHISTVVGHNLQPSSPAPAESHAATLPPLPPVVARSEAAPTNVDTPTRTSILRLPAAMTELGASPVAASRIASMAAAAGWCSPATPTASAACSTVCPALDAPGMPSQQATTNNDKVAHPNGSATVNGIAAGMALGPKPSLPVLQTSSLPLAEPQHGTTRVGIGSSPARALLQQQRSLQERLHNPMYLHRGSGDRQYTAAPAGSLPDLAAAQPGLQLHRPQDVSISGSDSGSSSDELNDGAGGAVGSGGQAGVKDGEVMHLADFLRQPESPSLSSITSSHAPSPVVSPSAYADPSYASPSGARHGPFHSTPTCSARADAPWGHRGTPEHSNGSDSSAFVNAVAARHSPAASAGRQRVGAHVAVADRASPPLPRARPRPLKVHGSLDHLSRFGSAPLDATAVVLEGMGSWPAAGAVRTRLSHDNGGGAGLHAESVDATAGVERTARARAHVLTSVNPLFKAHVSGRRTDGSDALESPRSDLVG